MALVEQGDEEQTRHYAAKVQRWYDQHIEAWLEAGILTEDPRSDWNPPMGPACSVRELAGDLQGFPRPGQANLNSTATPEERSDYIAAVLGWWNQRVSGWVGHQVLDPAQNPVVNTRYQDQPQAVSEPS